MKNKTHLKFLVNVKQSLHLTVYRDCFSAWCREVALRFKVDGGQSKELRITTTELNKCIHRLAGHLFDQLIFISRMFVNNSQRSVIKINDKMISCMKTKTAKVFERKKNDYNSVR